MKIKYICIVYPQANEWVARSPRSCVCWCLCGCICDDDWWRWRCWWLVACLSGCHKPYLTFVCFDRSANEIKTEFNIVIWIFFSLRLRRLLLRLRDFSFVCLKIERSAAHNNHFAFCLSAHYSAIQPKMENVDRTPTSHVNFYFVSVTLHFRTSPIHNGKISERVNNGRVILKWNGRSVLAPHDGWAELLWYDFI